MENLVAKAFELAHRSHLGQYRKNGGAPYIIHPLEVVKCVGRWGITKIDFPEVWAIALLHDVLEDTTTTYDTILKECGLVVATGVTELTFVESVESKHAYLQSFDRKGMESLAVKIADRLCNVEDYLYEDPKYAPKYFAKGKPIFNAMLNRRVELVNFYGNEVVLKMLADWGRVTRLCQGVV